MTKTFHLAAIMAGALSTFGLTGAATAADKDPAGAYEPSGKTTPRSAPDQDTPAADNTGTNQRDRKDSEPTADQQKNGKSDLDLTAEIRRSVMADKALSTNAHNVKIIAENGKVTLKGPVATAKEKKIVEKKAQQIAGSANVVSEIQIKK
jgi:hyperosmotically inducible protein